MRRRSPISESSRPEKFGSFAFPEAARKVSDLDTVPQLAMNPTTPADKVVCCHDPEAVLGPPRRRGVKSHDPLPSLRTGAPRLVESTYRPIPTEQIAFDKENPRIKVALEKYGERLDDERIRFALQTATGGSPSASSYRSLKDSIRAARRDLRPHRRMV